MIVLQLIYIIFAKFKNKIYLLNQTNSQTDLKNYKLSLIILYKI